MLMIVGSEGGGGVGTGGGVSAADGVSAPTFGLLNPRSDSVLGKYLAQRCGSGRLLQD